MAPNVMTISGADLAHACLPGNEAPDLVIGLVNNMPLSARRSTELEFRTVLAGAAPARRLHLRYFALPGDIEAGSHYEPLASLFETARNTLPIDGLIVTGTEPRAERLDDEPYWPDMARLIDWAASHTISTIWSCLAAQAAVLRVDGIIRRALPQKISGVFECVKVSDHPFLTDAPAHWPVPHSRLNDLDEYVLAESGYQILSRAPQIGVDSFLKQVGNSLFLLLQGHPEYGADRLLREYRRDIKRFLIGHRARYPDLPQHYFDPAVTGQLLELRESAAHLSTEEVLAMFDEVVQPVAATAWHLPATALYARWIRYLAVQRQLRGDVVPAGLAVS